MSSKTINLGIIASILPHIFCCVMPVVVSVVGLFAPEFAHTDFIPRWIEPWIFVFSALMLGASWVITMHECGCHHNHKDNGNHHIQKIILGIVSVLFVASVVLHIIQH